MANFMYDLSIPAISQLQRAMPDQADFMQSVSVRFDPKYAFLFYAPVAFVLNPLVGRRLILATVLAEWINQILKWLSFGERPYWYLYSSGKFDPAETPIRQFPSTCEIGPGAPSGHSQLTAAVWFVILQSANDLIANHFKSLRPKDLSNLKKLSTLVYVSLITLVAVSRVYLACHFPQQCVAGALLGYIIASYVMRFDPTPRQLFGLPFVMAASAFAVHFIMRLFGFNPSWTFELAQRHCENSDYIHLDTTPFFSIMRYCGFAFGAAIGEYARQAWDSSNERAGVESKISGVAQVPAAASGVTKNDQDDAKNSFNFASVITKLAIVLISSRYVDNLGDFVSSANLSVFYSAAFGVYAAFGFLIVNL